MRAIGRRMALIMVTAVALVTRARAAEIEKSDFWVDRAVADARRMHLQPQEIPLRLARRERDQRFAVAEADLQRDRRRPVERRCEIDRRVARLDAPRGPQLAPGTLLRLRHATCAHDEAADGSPPAGGPGQVAGLAGVRAGVVHVWFSRVQRTTVGASRGRA